MIDRERISARQHRHDNLNTTHLPLSPSPEGGGGTQAAPPVTSLSAPGGGEGRGEVGALARLRYHGHGNETAVMPGYLRPTALDDALAALSSRRLTVLAGGTDFYPARVGAPLDDNVLDITALAALRGIEERDDHWRIPALATWTDLVHADLPPWFDGLKLAAREIGGRQVQNAGTLCGNLCNASPAADGVPVLLSLDALKWSSPRWSGGRRCRSPTSCAAIGRRHLRPTSSWWRSASPSLAPNGRAGTSSSSAPGVIW